MFAQAKQDFMLWYAQTQYRLFDAPYRAPRLPNDFFQLRPAHRPTINQAAKSSELVVDRFKAVLNLQSFLQHSLFIQTKGRELFSFQQMVSARLTVIIGFALPLSDETLSCVHPYETLAVCDSESRKNQVSNSSCPSENTG
jgi:hypothetical protein